jgi:acetyl esterase/lipase
VSVYAAPAASSTETAIVLCQGGGYSGHYEAQGEPFARWLSEHGACVFLLKYRLGSAGYHYPSQLNDVSRTVRLVRARAKEWGVNPTRVGAMGFSAGGHLVSSLCVSFDPGNPQADDPIERQSCRPDFAILCYPVISMLVKPEQGSLHNLLGDKPSEDTLRMASSELNVRPDTPACFVWHTVEDTLVPPDHSILFATALLKAGVPCELHLYERGPHGTGLLGANHPWTNDLLHWMRQRGGLLR